MPSLMKRIFRPYEAAIDVKKMSQEADVIDPFKQKMLEDYMMQNPEEDFTGIPGLEAVQKRFDKKILAQGGPLFRAKKDEEGKTTGYTPKKGAKEKLDRDKMNNPMQMGSSGPKYMSGTSRKDQIFQKIQEMRESGMPISASTAAWEKKYLGVKDSKKGPTTDLEFMRVRKVAKDMANELFIEEGGDPKLSGPKQEHIEAFQKDAMKMLWPNADIEKVEVPDYDLKWEEHIKNNIKSQKDAVDYLVEQGIDEEEATQWVRERL